MLSAVITTIQEPTPSVNRLAARLAESGGKLIVAGDSKGPASFSISETTGFAARQLLFLSLDSQRTGQFELGRQLPTKHYARKNVAYLEAIAGGASCVYETDDDNAPLERWQPRTEYLEKCRFGASRERTGPAWVNVYRHFSEELIWPRGLPLNRIHTTATMTDQPESFTPTVNSEGACWAPIQQGLADGAPDVDAIWRLVFDREFRFRTAPSVYLSPGQWCPFNTQSTWWWPAAYPLLYIPSHCSFRMCDIWKSFIAQRCLWELNAGIVFHAPEVWQDRNVHNLMRDFQDEVPGYLENHLLAAVLEKTSLHPGLDQVYDNLVRCYESLVEANILPAEELPLVRLWGQDLELARTMQPSLT